MTAAVYKAFFTVDRNLAKAMALWTELMPNVTAISFSRMGGNSLNYKVRATAWGVQETFMLKITSADSSSELLSSAPGARAHASPSESLPAARCQCT